MKTEKIMPNSIYNSNGNSNARSGYNAFGYFISALHTNVLRNSSTK